MDHPNIAHVFDAGTTTNGRPYFAMELVDGIPITQYCDSKRLSIRERIELFVGNSITSDSDQHQNDGSWQPTSIFHDRPFRPGNGREFKHTTHVPRVAIFSPAMSALAESSMP